jgi:hypothetical protein
MSSVRASRTSEDCGKLLDGPVQISGAYDERRRNPQHHVVGFFAQDAATSQRLTEGTRWAIQLDANQQTTTSDLAHVRALDGTQTSQQRTAERSRLLTQLFVT